MLGACVICLGLALARRRPAAVVGIGVLAAYLAILTSYSFAIQQAFVASWRNEQHFWGRVVDRVPDLQEGTVIIVWDRGLPQNPFIDVSSWADPLVIEQLFHFPPNWRDPPRLWVVKKGWTKSLDWNGQEATWIVPAATWAAHRAVLPQYNTVLLSYAKGKLSRERGEFMVEGHPLHLKDPVPGASPSWDRGALYRLLIPGPG